MDEKGVHQMLDALKTSSIDQTMLDNVLVSKPTPRVERLREAFFSLEPKLSIERARIETRILKETEGQPMITRRAKVFAAVVREMPIDIYPDELLVGFTGDGPRCTNISPMNAWVMERKRDSHLGEKARVAPVSLSEADAKELAEELTPYWKQQGRTGRWWNYGHNIHGTEPRRTRAHGHGL